MARVPIGRRQFEVEFTLDVPELEQTTSVVESISAETATEAIETVLDTYHNRVEAIQHVERL